MTFFDSIGLAPGRIHLAPKKLSYRVGDTIAGTLKLELDKPLEGQRLVIALSARQRSVGLSPTGNGVQLTMRNDEVFRFERELGGARTWRPGESVPFALKIPTGWDEAGVSAPGGLIGDVTRALSFLAHLKRFPLTWTLSAVLEREWLSINPRGEVQLEVELDTAAAKKPRAKAKRTVKKKPSTPKKKPSGRAPRR